MKTSRYLLILAAFLVMVSSVFILRDNNPTLFKSAYLNIAAMLAIALAVSTRGFKAHFKQHRNNPQEKK